MPDNSHTSVNLSEVLYENAIDGASYSIVAGDPEDPGFEAANMVDWRDFSYFKADNQTVDFTLTETSTIDTWSTFIEDGAIGTVSLYYEDPVATFNLIDTIILAATPPIQWANFSEVTVPIGQKIRFVFNFLVGPYAVRQISIGQRMQFASGQWSGISPTELNQGIVNGNTMSVNGSFLGRNRRRFEKKGNIKLENLSQSWVRSTWEPFSLAAAEHAFFYRWNPTEYPDDVSFAVGEIRGPENTTAGNMSVSMPIMYLTE